MLRDWMPAEMPEEEELKPRLEAAREKLAVQQLQMKEKKVPVLVLVEGWGTSGKGSGIGSIIQNNDPRFFKVFDMEKKTEEDARKPFLYRHFAKIPEAGKFVFLDSGWMGDTVGDYLRSELKESEYTKRIESIRRFERQLTDNGYLVMKFFLHISEKEQKKRIKNLAEEKDNMWRVNRNDMWQKHHYEKWVDAFAS